MLERSDVIPVENEIKIVIQESRRVEEQFSRTAEHKIHIEQKYLTCLKGLSVRVRASYYENIACTVHEMTVKKDVGGQVVEIETTISETDFTKLWPTGFKLVVKTRYLYKGWEVDFFKSRAGMNYFAVAEFEMPPWQLGPDEVPDMIKENTIFSVPYGDKRFSNKKLGNMNYAINLLDNIREININSSARTG